MVLLGLLVPSTAPRWRQSRLKSWAAHSSLGAQATSYFTESEPVSSKNERCGWGGRKRPLDRYARFIIHPDLHVRIRDYQPQEALNGIIKPHILGPLLNARKPFQLTPTRYRRIMALVQLLEYEGECFTDDPAIIRPHVKSIRAHAWWQGKAAKRMCERATL